VDGATEAESTDDDSGSRVKTALLMRRGRASTGMCERPGQWTRYPFARGLGHGGSHTSELEYEPYKEERGGEE